LKCCKFKKGRVIRCKRYKKYFKVCKFKLGHKKWCHWRGKLKRVTWRCKKSKKCWRKLKCCKFVNGYKVGCKLYKRYYKFSKFVLGTKKFSFYKARLPGYRKRILKKKLLKKWKFYKKYSKLKKFKKLRKLKKKCKKLKKKLRKFRK